MEPVRVRDLVSAIHTLAPFSLQESYDNSGLLAGDPNDAVSGVLVSLDMTEAVVHEAMEKGCNVVVAHHPVIFRPLKSLTGRNHIERTVMLAIRNRISLVAVHTNLDNVAAGVNAIIAGKLGLTGTRILSPSKGNLLKLVTFVPEGKEGDVLDALHHAGAGAVGNYSHCSFRSPGTGSFRPGEAATPSIGTHGQQEELAEIKLEVILPAHAEHQVLAALKKAHPYEEVAYFMTPLTNQNQNTGAGMIGNLPKPINEIEFLKLLKINFLTQCIRYTSPPGKEIRTVAVCGGSGSFLLNAAMDAGADAFVTADFKYHEFFDADGRIMIADIGHYESEQFTGELLVGFLSGKFTTFATIFCETVTNPIRYYN